jgi:hypothetical protein
VFIWFVTNELAAVFQCMDVLCTCHSVSGVLQLTASEARLAHMPFCFSKSRDFKLPSAATAAAAGTAAVGDFLGCVEKEILVAKQEVWGPVPASSCRRPLAKA